MSKNNRTIPVYPILLSLYPTLALLSHNIGEVDPLVGLRALFISAIFFSLLWGIVFLFYRDLNRSALLTTVFCLLFFSYGHVFTALQSSSLATIAHHRFLLILALIILLFTSWIIPKVTNFKTLTQALNWISLFLILAVVVPIVEYRISLMNAMRADSTVPVINQVHTDGTKYPDVYYIILDSYTRADALQRDFELDTNDFLTAMQDRGFYVADCARSNYGFTELSMASAFNMDYVDHLNPKIQPGNSNLTLATALIKRNAVRARFESYGYKIVAFETGYAWNYWEDADLFLTDEGNLFTASDIQPFEYLLMDTTGLKAVRDLFPNLLTVQSASTHHARHVKRTLFELEQVGDLPDLGAPKFVYVHINVPHVPFIFKPDGSLLNNPDYFRGDQDYPVSEEYFVAGYRNQVEFINHRILQTVDEILQRSATPPVIIVQGDHGIRGKNRLQILNMYLIPGGSEELYASITPVNSFRVIFNAIFQTQLPLVEDRSFTSTHELPYDLEEVPENAPHCLKD